MTTPVNLCNKTYTHKRKDREKLKFLIDRIREEYMHQWIVDNMPVAWCYRVIGSDTPFCNTRFPVGCYVNDDGVKHSACFLSVSPHLCPLPWYTSMMFLIQEKLIGKGTTYLFNNVRLVLSYHRGTEPLLTDGRIVRAAVTLDSCQDHKCYLPMIIDSPALRRRLKGRNEMLQIPYMYRVEFVEEEEIKWASRWDYMMNSTQAGLNWLYLINFIVIITFLTLMITLIMLRLFHPDFLKDKKQSVSSHIHMTIITYVLHLGVCL